MDSDRTAPLWDEALRRLRAESAVSVGFGGAVEGTTVRIRHLAGARTELLRGLPILAGRGLGGRAWREVRTLGVDDYRSATDISHHYDRPVAAEGLRAVVAAPVVAAGTVRGVLYAGVREAIHHGDRLLDAVTRSSRWLAGELAVEAEVERRTALRTARLQRLEAAAGEQLRLAHAGLRELYGTVADPEVKRSLGDLLETLTPGTPDAPVLSRRELDVLTQVATGATYGEVAARLGLTASTVKSYMRDVLVRLDAHSRHEAVVVARRRGLIP